jgi:hypothetical protein
MSACRVKFFLLSDALKLLMLFVLTMTDVEPVAFILIVFHGDTFKIDKMLIVFG